MGSELNVQRLNVSISHVALKKVEEKNILPSQEFREILWSISLTANGYAKAKAKAEMKQLKLLNALAL